MYNIVIWCVDKQGLDCPWQHNRILTEREKERAGEYICIYIYIYVYIYTHL